MRTNKKIHTTYSWQVIVMAVLRQCRLTKLIKFTAALPWKASCYLCACFYWV